MNVAKQILVVYFSGGGFVMTRIIPALEVANLVPHLIDINLAIDVISGPIWYRLLQGHAALDDDFADGVIRQILFGIWAK